MKYLGFTLFLFLFLIGCKKEHAPETPSEAYTENRTVHLLNDSLVANYLFLPGTWWVYRDLSDNSRDSIYIFNTVFDVFNITVIGSPGGGAFYHDYERYEMILGGNTHETNRYYLLTNQFRLSFNEWEQINVFGYDENTDSTVSAYNRVAFYDSIQIQNIWYYDVAKTKIYTYYHSCCPIPDLDIYYINKEFGIIKKEIANSDSTFKIYELINSNIVH